MRLNLLYQVTILFAQGGFNRFTLPIIPKVGDEVSIVHGDSSEEVYRITKVRIRGYRELKDGKYAHESDAMIWGEIVDLGGRPPFFT